jgi:hypothetical protein
MEICSDGHDEICYESRACPACSLKDENAELQQKIKELKQSKKLRS